MEKYIYDKNNVLWYELQGDYYIPCLGDRGRFSVSLVLYRIFYDFLGNPRETV